MKTLYQIITMSLVLIISFLLSSCDAPSYTPEIGSCVDVSIEMSGISLASNQSSFDTVSYHQSIIYPHTIYTVAGETVSFGNISSFTLSKDMADIKHITYLVTSKEENSLCVVAKNVDPAESFSGTFDAGVYNLAVCLSWDSSHPNLPNGFSWAINFRVVVVDNISDLPYHISPIGDQCFNLKLTRALTVEP